MTRILRVMLMDLDAEPTYSNDRLEEVLCVAAQLVRNELTFSQNFEVDLGGLDITPDPCDKTANTRDDSYINLVCLKAACIVEKGESRSASSQAIAIKDGSSAIDLRSVVDAKLKIIKEGGWCKQYEGAKLEYQAGQVRVAGHMIMSPFRLYSAGTYRTGHSWFDRR